MREGSELQPTSPTSPTTALTTTRKLGHVTGTENLPPSVAREVAEIVATYPVTGADFLRHDVLKLAIRMALIGGGYAVWVGTALAVMSVVIGSLLGICISLPILWRKRLWRGPSSTSRKAASAGGPVVIWGPSWA